MPLSADGIFTETLFDAYGQQIRADNVLHHKQKDPDNPFDWEVLLFENSLFGKVLTMDGTVQLTTKDEAHYHEMMVHVPMFAHPKPKKVLIIGGGDGGILREVLKHDVDSVTMVEISQDVVDLSKKYLPEVSQGAFDDRRATVVYADGAKYVQTTQEQFDVIITDSTDAIGPGAVLFGQEYYEHCKKRLKPGGIVVTQNGSAVLQAQQIRDTYARLPYEDVTFFSAHVPTYPGGEMFFGWGSDDASLRHTPDWIIRKRFAAAATKNPAFHNLVYYHPNMQSATFKMPQFVENELHAMNKLTTQLDEMKESIRRLSFHTDYAARTGHTEFMTALSELEVALRGELYRHVEKHKRQHKSSRQVTEASLIVKHTNEMLADLLNPATQDKLAVVANYENACKGAISPKSKLMQKVAMVCAAAAGFVLGVLITSVSFIAALPTGPGAIVAAVVGLLAAGAVCGAITGATSRFFMGKPTGVRLQALNAADQGKRVVVGM